MSGKSSVTKISILISRNTIGMPEGFYVFFPVGHSKQPGMLLFKIC